MTHSKLQQYNEEQKKATARVSQTIANNKPTRSPGSRRNKHTTAKLDPLDRAKAKATFLAAMGRRNVIGDACKAAGITRAAYQYWVNTGYLTIEELQEAYADFQDRLAGLNIDLGVEGIAKPLTNNGHLVLAQNGQPIMVPVIDSKLLMRLSEIHLPGYASSAKVDITTHDGQPDMIMGIPSQYALCIDIRLLTDERAL
jgi:hypothetical protein